MKASVSFSIDSDVLSELGKIPSSKRSILVNNFLRNYFKDQEVKDDTNPK